ncbi:hypothetical protein Fmac_031056 [Flemingia macrophylla]|uniref:Uncharacterized protein n=1 Tax=Flemingia macrophylla TaxID=520843 RepID=A0ABD1L278_9FABA
MANKMSAVIVMGLVIISLICVASAISGTATYYTCRALRRISAAHPSITFLRLPPALCRPRHLRPCQLLHLRQSPRDRPLLHLCHGGRVLAADPRPLLLHLRAAILALCCHLPALHLQTMSSFRDMAGVELCLPGIAAALKTVNMPEPMLDRNDSTYWDMLEFCTQLPRATRWCVTPEAWG